MKQVTIFWAWSPVALGHRVQVDTTLAKFGISSVINIHAQYMMQHFVVIFYEILGIYVACFECVKWV